MIGLILLVCIVVYLALSIGIIVLVGKWAKKRGRRRWPWCTTAGVAMYLLIAWDQVPTYVAGKYYCASQSGLSIYKEPEQWLRENPGASGKLTWQKIPQQKDIEGRGFDLYTNQGFTWSVRFDSLKIIPVNFQRHEVIDRSHGNVLVRYVGVTTGYDTKYQYKGWKKLKFWVGGIVCRDKFSDFLRLENIYNSIGKEAEQ
jgi:hypothetical protein